MKNDLSKGLFVGILMTFVMISFSFPSLAAEKKAFSMSLKQAKIISENALQKQGSVKIFIKQGEAMNSITDSTDPNLIGAEENVYLQMDITYGQPGTERGYTITRTKDGDYFYSRYESTFKVIRKDFPKTEIESSSKHQFIGGTGKYTDIKGSYSCQGKTTTDKEVTAKCEGEWEF